METIEKLILQEINLEQLRNIFPEDSKEYDLVNVELIKVQNKIAYVLGALS